MIVLFLLIGSFIATFIVIIFDNGIRDLGFTVVTTRSLQNENQGGDDDEAGGKHANEAQLIASLF